MKSHKKAFTLVELIVVIVILAILGTIAFISLQGYSANSRDSVRISDVSTLKTALGVFHVGSGKYPLPDNGEEVSYSGTTLRTQGTIGETVIKNLSRSMTKIPTDPSTSLQYVYSVTSTQNEYEILNLLEGDIGYIKDYTANALNGTRVPRIAGEYNGLYIKTPTLIFPTPSIINAQPIIQGAGLVLDINNIKSQVIDGGENIPNLGGNITIKTGALDINLSVYNGTINKDSTDQQKIDAIKAIQGAYSGTSLAGINEYKILLEKTQDEDLLKLADTYILSKSSNSQQQEEKLNKSCGQTISGETKDFWNLDIVESGQSCDTHKKTFTCENSLWKDGENIADINTYIYESCSVLPDTESPTGGSFTINNNAISTTSTNITLNIVCPTDTGGSYPIQIAYGNSSNPINWTPCVANISHVLTTGDGLKTVYIRFKDSSDNITNGISDDIQYTAPLASGCILYNSYIRCSKMDPSPGSGTTNDGNTLSNICTTYGYSYAGTHILTDSMAFTVANLLRTELGYSTYTNIDGCTGDSDGGNSFAINGGGICSRQTRNQVSTDAPSSPWVSYNGNIWRVFSRCN